MEGQPVKAHLCTEELEGPRCAVACIADNGVAGEPGVAPDLMPAARYQVALYEGVTSASTKNPEAGFARDGPAMTFGMDAAPCPF